MIEIPTDDDRRVALWKELIRLGEIFTAPWTLIGAQMVQLHGLEHGVECPRLSIDIDVLAGARLLPGAPRILASELLDAGYRFDGAGANNVGHRFRKGQLNVDVLAPDGLDPRADLGTTAGARTVAVPGGSQALRRTESVDVRCGETDGRVPRPDLVGAILIKARAVGVDDLPDAQLRDLAFLLSLAENPRDAADQLRDSERRWLRRRDELLEPDHPAWHDIDRAEDGIATLRLMIPA